MLDRTELLPELIGDWRNLLIIAGLGNAVFDIIRLTDDAPTVFPLDGAMGAAVSLGLGLAVARPDRRVLVVTGDGELLMNLGALATVAYHDPPNLSILCLDNARYGLTGGQASHTSRNTDLGAIARGAGIRQTATVTGRDDVAAAATVLRSDGGTSFVHAKIAAHNSKALPVDRDGASCRRRFRNGLVPRSAS